MRDHLRSVAKRGVVDPRLRIPPLPAPCKGLWEVFNQIAGSVGNNGFGRNPITWPDLLAWQQVTGTRLSAWEADTLIDMDQSVRAVLQSSSENNEHR